MNTRQKEILEINDTENTTKLQIKQKQVALLNCAVTSEEMTRLEFALMMFKGKKEKHYKILLHKTFLKHNALFHFPPYM